MAHSNKLTSLHDCPAPAKLNLFLHVTGRRADGYHLLQSVFQLIDHGDTLHFDLRTDGMIRRSTQVPGGPEAEDLIRRAYGSEDFHEGVQAFGAKRKPVWRGR